MKKLKPFFFGVLATLGLSAGVAWAATFNLFQPAAGILKGNPSTYVTTAAASSDVISLWSGTCNSTTALRGDGSCGAIPAGTVTSVGLTVPSGLSVTGSPVTTSGTLAISTTLNGVIHGNGTGFTAGNVALGSEVSGTLPVGNGGTGAATLTGVLKGNGASAFTAAASSDVISLWSGTCDATTFLRGDGSCQTAGGGASGANPTATIGLTAVNGSAGTFTRSDGAPALSQSIAPTWTGTHIFNGTGFSVATSGVIPTRAFPGANYPNILYAEPSGASGNRAWLTGINSIFAGSSASIYQIAQCNDALSSCAAAVNITAASGAISNLGFGNATNNPSFNFLGSGTVAVAGNVTVAGSSVCRADGTNCPAGSAGSGASATAGGSTNFNANVDVVAVALSTEEFDTGSFHSTVTNNSRVILPSATGYASCSASVSFIGGTWTSNPGVANEYEYRLLIRKNGSSSGYIASSSDFIMRPITTGSSSQGIYHLSTSAAMIPANGTDYVEMYVYASGSFDTNPQVIADSGSSSAVTRLTCSKI